jgi:hypothetical protein
MALDSRIIANLLDQLDGLKGTSKKEDQQLMLIFHDPGARNHCLPLAEYGRTLGANITTVDLRSMAADTNRAASELMLDVVGQAQECTTFVFGCSTNRVERIGIAAANNRGARTVQFIDAPGICSRLDLLQPAEMADAYLLSVQSMVKALATDVPAAKGHVCGSTHVEKCLNDARAQHVDQVLELQKLNSAGYFDGIDASPAAVQVIAFFLAPEELTINLSRKDVTSLLRHSGEGIIEVLAGDASGISAAAAVTTTTTTPTTTTTTLFVARTHPRTDPELLKMLVDTCNALNLRANQRDGVRFQAILDHGGAHKDIVHGCTIKNRADNPLMIRASSLTLSFGSTMAIESICFGVAHAFVQLGWAPSDAFLDENYGWLDIPRIHDPAQFKELLSAGGGCGGGGNGEAGVPLAVMKRALEKMALGSAKRAWNQAIGNRDAV